MRNRLFSSMTLSAAAIQRSARMLFRALKAEKEKLEGRLAKATKVYRELRD